MKFLKYALFLLSVVVTQDAFSAGPSFTIHDLGTLPGGAVSEANSINNLGQAVGFASTAAFIHGAFFANGSVTDLGTLPGGTNSSVFSINDRGETVGLSDTGTGAIHAVLWTRTP